jgi:hypothetical protein
LFKSISKLSVISHFGHEEQFPVKNKKSIELKNLTIETLAFLEMDTLLEILG